MHKVSNKIKFNFIFQLTLRIWLPSAISEKYVDIK